MNDSFRSYEKLKGKRTYWNLRITKDLKMKAQLIAYRIGVSPAKVARDGIESEVSRLEEGLRNVGSEVEGEEPDEGNGASV